MADSKASQEPPKDLTEFVDIIELLKTGWGGIYDSVSHEILGTLDKEAPKERRIETFVKNISRDCSRFINRNPESKSDLRAYIAGGYLLYLFQTFLANSCTPGAEAYDVDVWFTHNSGDNTQSIRFHDIATTFPYFAQENERTIVKTYTFTTECGKSRRLPVNGVCFIGSIFDIVKSFDLDICQILFDGEKLWGTRAFVEAFEQRRSSVTPYRQDATDSHYRSPERLLKYARRGWRPQGCVYEGNRLKGALAVEESRLRARPNANPTLTVWADGGLDPNCDVTIRCIGSHKLGTTRIYDWGYYRKFDETD